MERKPRQEKSTEVDLTKPLVIPPLDETQCYGHLFSLRDKDCALCHDAETCSIIVTLNKTKPEKEKFEQEKGPTIDMMDFERVDEAKLVSIINKYIDDGAPMLYTELQEYIASQAQTKDTDSVRYFIDMFLGSNQLTIKEGEIWPIN